jgi:hypothetical protein
MAYQEDVRHIHNIDFQRVTDIWLEDLLRIRDLHDPDNRYAGLGALRNTKVECPDVRDGNGVLIHPQEYKTRLPLARFVEVEVYLKLYVTMPEK